MFSSDLFLEVRDHRNSHSNLCHSFDMDRLEGTPRPSPTIRSQTPTKSISSRFQQYSIRPISSSRRCRGHCDHSFEDSTSRTSNQQDHRIFMPAPTSSGRLRYWLPGRMRIFSATRPTTSSTQSSQAADVFSRSRFLYQLSGAAEVPGVTGSGGFGVGPVIWLN